MHGEAQKVLEKLSRELKRENKRKRRQEHASLLVNCNKKIIDNAPSMVETKQFWERVEILLKHGRNHSYETICKSALGAIVKYSQYQNMRNRYK